MDAWRDLWGTFGVSGRPGRFRTYFRRSFFDFGSPLGPQGPPKEAQGAQKRPKWCPKCPQREPNIVLKACFLEVSETLIFDDGTTILKCFCYLGGARASHKVEKKYKRSGETNKCKQILQRDPGATKKSAGARTRADKNEKGVQKGRGPGPNPFTPPPPSHSPLQRLLKET